MAKSPVWKHFAAFIYDIFPIVGLFLVTSMIILLFRNGVEVEMHSPWLRALLIFEVAFYYIYSWKVGGQTLGMRAWKIKIFPINDHQIQISWEQATFRFFIGILSTCLIGFGLFWKYFSANNKSWMDIVSHSKTQDIS